MTRAERPRTPRCAGLGDGGGADAHESLRKILGFTGAQIVEDACLRLPLARGDVGEDGLIAPEEARASIVGALTALAAVA